MLVIIMILKDTTTFQVLFIVSLFYAWNITTVEINSGIHLLKSEIRQVPLFTFGGLGLVILVLVLRIWSCLHHCRTELKRHAKLQSASIPKLSILLAEYPSCWHNNSVKAFKAKTPHKPAVPLAVTNISSATLTKHHSQK